MEEQKAEFEFVDTPPFKLKDKGKRGYQAINLKKQFGFIPEVIVIEKFVGENNVLRVRAVKPKKNE